MASVAESIALSGAIQTTFPSEERANGRLGETDGSQFLG